jgi:hypothetical protein
MIEHPAGWPAHVPYPEDGGKGGQAVHPLPADPSRGIAAPGFPLDVYAFPRLVLT